MTYYHYESYYFKVCCTASRCGNRLDKKPCSLSKFVWFPLDVVIDSTYLASPSIIRDLSVGHHICHRSDKIYILMRSATIDTLFRPMLMRSATFDTLARPVLPEEVMYLNRITFCSWVGHSFQFIVIKQRSSRYKSLGNIFNQTYDRIGGE
jgi:hypothetical protein